METLFKDRYFVTVAVASAVESQNDLRIQLRFTNSVFSDAIIKYIKILSLSATPLASVYSKGTGKDRQIHRTTKNHFENYVKLP